MGSIEREYQQLQHEQFVKHLKNKNRKDLEKLISKYTKMIENNNYSSELYEDFYSASKKLNAVFRRCFELM